jgi:DnaK suppressor protein
VSIDTSARPPTAPVRTSVTGKESVRLLLEEHRHARLDQIKALTFSEPTGSDLDPGARMRVLAAAKLTVEEIDAALLRLDDGSYGMCLGCTERIVAERLLVVPYARYCVPCATRA